jgi:N-formylglutamate deformylase
VNFEIVPGDPSSPYIVHVPHSSTRIPDDVRAQIVLDDDALAQELALMTDAGAEELAIVAADAATPRPWLFVNRLSRLVVDPERLPDAHEVMHEVGMGAVYTRTSAGLVLRDDDELVVGTLFSRFFTPYAEAMADLVDARIFAAGRAVVLDLHSYPVTALPYERYQQARRPPVCLGVDFDHTPAALVDQVSRALSVVGDILVNEPFIGSYIPIRHFGRDNKVTSVMVELRRDMYLRQDGSMDPQGASRITRALVAILGS